MTQSFPRDALTKVPAVTLGFWVIKVLATIDSATGTALAAALAGFVAVGLDFRRAASGEKWRE